MSGTAGLGVRSAGYVDSGAGARKLFYDGALTGASAQT
jgi:hypothetical protein